VEDREKKKRSAVKRKERKGEDIHKMAHTGTAGVQRHGTRTSEKGVAGRKKNGETHGKTGRRSTCRRAVWRKARRG